MQKDGRTHTAKIQPSPGGVARNMVEALLKLGHDPIFLSAVGMDLFGRELMLQFEMLKIEKTRILSSKLNSTAIYSALLNNSGECLFGMGDMEIHSEIDTDYVKSHRNVIESAPIVVLDANIPTHTISTVLKLCKSASVPVWFEPTEIRKAKKICSIPSDYLQAISYISPNIHELKSILDAASNSGYQQQNTESKKTLKFKNIPDANPEEVKAIIQCFHLLPQLQVILLTKGSDGILITFKEDKSRLNWFRHPPPSINPEDIVSVSGAGDCLNAGFISGILSGCTWESCAQIGTKCASQSLQSVKNVPDSFVM